MQSDDISIVDIKPEVQKFTAKLNNLAIRPIVGGWEETFKAKVNEQNVFCDVNLWLKEHSTK